MTTKKSKIYQYSIWNSFKYEGTKYSFQSQLYQIGVYAIINNDPAKQLSLTPGQIVSLEKRLRADFKSGKITDLEFSAPIRVRTDENGFWVKVD